ncbi:hypothetical protein HZY62_15360 [Maribacter polysiphoniae]|uniref:Prepilin-type N-terminal cleavage/methylation domain-containing protein n=1 Tax=Maribacter polysiphoniae TaxID=429344 RepID=A0A316DUQ0_9FLAO|nr:hypothetical protein [Maribacter polysiphoniae]MBD1261980.1 hypothetical protein [Maribacter polysiphoniae]PWK21665.1 hypothetical protein LX92_03444 [Maribacter polysiphoniae]
MVVLRRIKASTLMETLVATVLIVIIFMISSMLLNNLFSNSITGNNQRIKEQLHRLQYEYGHHGIKLPYYQDTGDWQYSITKEKKESVNVVVFQAMNPITQESITKISVDEE